MSSAADERKRRLAQALRENLKRRKAQDRARREPGDAAGERAEAENQGPKPQA